ncbi:gephyrin-like molybdotransferase Glp [Idiomarina seosinensis]|uniref:Molybdopterin molybdenumtransferase n=1 Tax=Idiomarina seosinensis TaxID=281739 RepID=A0A432ZDS8_9GAMM|nr:gephyrin-like molybdotransferase Glp [Idiomarina seosinensis]RUO76106.1 molybdopterin molybdenumtransferase MoeA [Idiomarina seosinensis]
MSNMISVHDAITRMLDQVESPSVQYQQVSLNQALDRICAKDITSPIDVPGHDNSAMDGYAVNASNLNVGDTLKVVGASAAGHPFSDQIGSGECVRIMTGATIPEGLDAVVIQENTAIDNEAGTITLQSPVSAGDNIRLQGADVRKNSTVIAAGSRLSTIDIGLLGSLGIAEVPVQPQLSVAIFSTGDELVAPGSPLETGQIYDSNRYLIDAMLQRLSIKVIDFGHLPDDLEQIKGALVEASEQCDAIITSGGVSVGDTDHTKQALEALGEIGFWKVAMKPGKPFAFGQLNRAWFFGLPGNPVAAAVTMDQLVQPVLAKLAGESFNQGNALQVSAAESLKKRAGRADFQRGYFEQTTDGQLTVKSAGSQSSGVLSTMKSANCFIYLERERESVNRSETVSILPFSRLFS